MNIASALGAIIESPQFFGSLTANTREAWGKVKWQDPRRDKPTWAELEAAWSAVVIEKIIKDYEDRIQKRLDGFAKALTYENMLSACTYATSSIPMYRIEGQYCVDARDATWAKAYELLSAFQPGDPIPTWEAVEAQLPVLAWPEGSRGA